MCRHLGAEPPAGRVFASTGSGDGVACIGAIVSWHMLAQLGAEEDDGDGRGRGPEENLPQSTGAGVAAADGTGERFRRDRVLAARALPQSHGVPQGFKPVVGMTPRTEL